MPHDPEPLDPSVFDLGHQGDIDYTLLDEMLALTPTERLDKHEVWRLFAKEALRNAELRAATATSASER